MGRQLGKLATRGNTSKFLWAVTGALLIVACTLGLVATGELGANPASVAIVLLLSIITGLLARNTMKPKFEPATKDKTETLKTDTAGVSPVIAVILMVAITVVLAVTVFVMVNSISKDRAIPPVIAFSESGGNITVTSADKNLAWSDFAVQGCTQIPTGTIEAGDIIAGCAGHVTIRHVPSNTLSFDQDV